MSKKHHVLLLVDTPYTRGGKVILGVAKFLFEIEKSNCYVYLMRIDSPKMHIADYICFFHYNM